MASGSIFFENFMVDPLRVAAATMIGGKNGDWLTSCKPSFLRSVPEESWLRIFRHSLLLHCNNRPDEACVGKGSGNWRTLALRAHRMVTCRF